MGKLMCSSHKHSTSVAIIVISVLILLPLFQRIYPLLPYSWNLLLSTSLRLWIFIQRPPFIYFIFNSIVFYILHLNFFKKVKPPPHSSSQGQTTLTRVEGDHDTWWCQVEGRDGEEGKTAPLEEKEIINESDTLDATWEAIMEAKRKAGGPYLTKSDTWSVGNRKGRLGREKIEGEFKKWRTFKNADEERESSRGGCHGGGGWRRMEAVVTDYDELKKKSDAFISRFTRGIRLQRLESHQRFLKMINRGL